MKKLVVLCIISFLSFTESKSQVTSLEEFLGLTELSVIGIASVVQDDWKVLRPSQKSDGKSIITERHTYRIDYGEKAQILQRVIMFNTKIDTKLVSTNLLFNDVELLKDFEVGLSILEYELLSKEGTMALYKKGYNKILLEEAELVKGYFRITFYQW